MSSLFIFIYFGCKNQEYIVSTEISAIHGLEAKITCRAVRNRAITGTRITREFESCLEVLMSNLRRQWMAVCILVVASSLSFAQSGPRAKTRNGTVEGKTVGKNNIFLGIPYAAPPVGDLRWKPPQPAAAWSGIRQATEFGFHCMQGKVYGDMVFPDPGPSEDCLTLNVWAPVSQDAGKLPVMVWIYGGGGVAGASSEPRQNGANLAKRGVIVVSMNYRLGVFGSLVHPELAKESGHDSTGNYGLMDQVAALKWVHDNIATFGGDPANVTIFGESAGSYAVNAQMASPLAKGLFQKAIGESGSGFEFGDVSINDRRLREQKDPQLLKEKLGVSTIAELRAVPGEKLLKTFGDAPAAFSFDSVDADGYFLPESIPAVFGAGKQNDVPLLVGWNHDEASFTFRRTPATADWMKDAAKKDFGDKADELLRLYPIGSDELTRRSAVDYASDRWISFSTWAWPEAQIKSGKQPIYRYRFDQAPVPTDPKAWRPGAVHAVDIPFVFGNLDANKDMDWTPDDRHVSDIMMCYWSNFAKTGNPNGTGLAPWPRYTASDGYQVMYLSPEPHAHKDDQRDRYLFLSREWKTK